MTSRTKYPRGILDTLISEGKVQHIYGVIGCCKNYYVQFPNETQKYLYKPDKAISGKLSNKISNYLYTKANMQSAGSSNDAPVAASTGKRLTKKTKPSETNYGEIHHKSVNKIIHMLGRTIKMKVTKSTPALKKNTHTIDVNPSYKEKSRCSHRSHFRQSIHRSKETHKRQKLQSLHVFTLPKSTRWG